MKKEREVFMYIRKFLIAGGNPTLLCWDCSPTEKSEVIQKFLRNGDVDQIGFVSSLDGLDVSDVKLEMMGDELCINATIACASLLSGQTFRASGISEKVLYRNEQNRTSLVLDLPYSINNNVVLFNGIGFRISKGYENPPSKKQITLLAKKYKKPAFGEIRFQKNAIVPYIYVAGTNSLIQESACGSGSIAFSIFSGRKEVTQPSGQSISVLRKKNRIEISAKVQEVSPGILFDDFKKGGEEN